jgi:hypothetical protein
MKLFGSDPSIIGYKKIIKAWLANYLLDYHLGIGWINMIICLLLLKIQFNLPQFPHKTFSQ